MKNIPFLLLFLIFITIPVPARSQSTGVAPAAPPLQTRLDALRQKFKQKAAPEKVAIYEKGIQKVAVSGVLEQALSVGDQAPDFVLPDATEGKVRLSDILKDGPAILVWYRGVWCPYCNLTLQALQQYLPRFEEYDATLVALSPQLPDQSLSTVEKNDLKFTVLSDVDNVVARKYGIVYTLPVSVQEHFRGRINLETYNGNPSQELPLAATYVVDTDGQIIYAFVDADYRLRAEPEAILEALQNIE